MNLKQLTSTPRGRLILGAGGGGALALLAILRRRGAASSTPANATLDTSSPIYAPGLSGGDGSGGLAQTIDDTSAQTFNTRIGTLEDDIAAITTGLGDLQQQLTTGGLTGGGTVAPEPVAPAPPPPPAPPVSAPTPPASTFSPGLIRTGGFSSGVLFRNEAGNTAAKALSHAQSTAITQAAQAVRKTGRGTQFTIPGLSGTYFMNAAGNFERTK